MNNTHVRVINTCKSYKGEYMKKYRRLKRYWKLLLKNEDELTHLEYKHFPLFGQRTDAGIIQEMLAYHPDLHTNYILYQKLLRSMRNKNFDDLKGILLNIKTSDLSSYMKTSIKTIKKQLYYIENSFLYQYNNRCIEGVNNKIKVLNRLAYGYKNFYYFKNRIMLHFKLRLDLKQKETHTTAA